MKEVLARDTNRILPLVRLSDPYLADLLKLKHVDGMHYDAIAEQYNMARSTLYTHLNKAEKILEQVKNRLETPYANALKKLPRPELFGIENISQKLADTILSTNDFLAVQGIGGIGKTSLVRHAVHNVELLGRFDQLLWFDGLSSLQWQNRNVPALIVIDNADDISPRILERLSDILNPSKCVLISNKRIAQIKPFFSVPEMPQDAAMDYLASILRWYDIEIDCHKVQRRIYEVVGGHPIALRTLAEQNEILPLDDVLLNYSSEFGISEQLYNRIFNVDLSDDEKIILASLKMLGGTADAKTVMSLNGFATNRFNEPAKSLARKGFVQISGSYSKRIYSINTLTRTYSARYIGLLDNVLDGRKRA